MGDETLEIYGVFLVRFLILAEQSIHLSRCKLEMEN